MREIKFRVWNGDEYLAAEYSVNIPIIGFCDHELETIYDEIVIEQFTGLHDKNGKEIYEGDILRSGITSAEYLVFWSEENACFMKEHLLVNARDVDMLQDLSTCKIVGNIHETPEFLEEKER